MLDKIITLYKQITFYHFRLSYRSLLSTLKCL